MARALFVLALALLAAAVLAEYIYSGDQLDEINGRMLECLNDEVVPRISDFNIPGEMCRFEAGIRALSHGATKDQITAPIVACLSKAGVADEYVGKAQDCLGTILAKPLVSH